MDQKKNISLTHVHICYEEPQDVCTEVLYVDDDKEIIAPNDYDYYIQFQASPTFSKEPLHTLCHNILPKIILSFQRWSQWWSWKGAG